MKGTVMAQPSIYEQILDPANRANPYPLYAELRKTPVARQEDGAFVVSTYNEIVALLHDPRVSSDTSYLRESGGAVPAPEEGLPALPLPFINRDPPEHDRLRGLAMRHFGPPHTPGRIDGMRPWLTEVTTGLIHKFAGKSRADIVDGFACPLPVTAICKRLGAPLHAQPAFPQWPNTTPHPPAPNTEPLDQRTAHP